MSSEDSARITDEAYRENRARADRIAFLISAFLVVAEIIWVESIRDFYFRAPEIAIPSLQYVIGAHLVFIILYVVFTRCDIPYLKYIFYVVGIFAAYTITAYVSYQLAMMFILPLLFTVLYFDRKALYVMMPVGAVLMLVSLWVFNDHTPFIIGMYQGATWFDLFMQMVRSEYIPNLVPYLVSSVIAYAVISKGVGDIGRNVDIRLSALANERELSLAKDIQAGMLPSALPSSDSYCLSAVMRPAKEVGGDFYDCFELPDGRLVVLVADVSGKGTPAAIFMSCAMTVIHSNISSGSSLDSAMTKANSELLRYNRMRYFVTVWVGVLDTRSGELEYVCAGHNPPFVVRDGNASLVKSEPGFVFGRRKNIVYASQTIRLSPGDRLFLYTDGVTESRNTVGEMFGERRLSDSLCGMSGLPTSEFLESFLGQLGAFSSGTAQYDDITTLVLDYAGPSAESIEVPADRSGYSIVMEHLGKVLESASCSKEVVSGMKVVCSELFANIDMYGFSGKDKGTVRFTAAVKDGVLRMVFSDDGVRFNPLEVPEADTSGDVRGFRNGGLGITMVRKLVDTVDYEYLDGRNTLTITKEI